MVPKLAVLKEIAEYRRIAEIDQIGRRYLAMNAFDGVLTMIGVLMGSYIGGIKEPRVVLYTGLATSLAMGISGFSGAYMTETAERKRDLQELEGAMLRDLGHTKQARAFNFAVLVVSVIDGLAPLVAGISVLAPFVFPGLLGDMKSNYFVALGIAFILLFGLGAFLAKIARENVVRSGLRMLVAGLACVLLSFLLGTNG